MSLWKADDGTIHDDMDGNALSLPSWPQGMTKLTPAQVAALKAPTLAQAQAAKNAEINAARLSANQSTFPYAGKQIACDALSRSDLDGVLGFIALNSALPPGFPGKWKATDNTYVSVPDVATFNQMHSAMVAQGAANFAHAQTLKAEIAASTTIAQVQAIVW